MAILHARSLPILTWALVLGSFLPLLPIALSEGTVNWSIGQVEDPPADAPACPALSKAHLAKFANNNTVLITVVDQLIMRKFGKSWVENVKAAGIGYWLVAALDPWTSRLLGHWGVKQCFNAPMERLRYKGSGEALETVFPCNLCSVRHAPPCGQEMGSPPANAWLIGWALCVMQTASTSGAVATGRKPLGARCTWWPPCMSSGSTLFSRTRTSHGTRWVASGSVTSDDCNRSLIQPSLHSSGSHAIYFKIFRWPGAWDLCNRCTGD